MVIVNCALKQDDIKAIVEGIEVDGNKPFTFQKKQGLKLFFESTYAEGDEAGAKFVKKTIKATEIGKALFFSVEAK